MARRKRKISFKERVRSWWGTKTKKQAAARKRTVVGALKIAVVICFLAAIVAVLHYAEGYIRVAKPVADGQLELIDVPTWVNWDLKARVVAVAGGDYFPIREETAAVVARNLEPMAWLDDVEVQVTHEAVRVTAHWRKPVALIKRGASKFYADADLVILDYMPMAHLPIVEVEGVTMGAAAPAPGKLFDRDDLSAAVKLIIVLRLMDVEVAPKNPLLHQIASVDVSNFMGRKNSREPHLVLRTKDGTQILWGAELGEWAKYLEAKDDQKLAKLYTYYKEFGSLDAGAKYINLRDPQDKVPQPIDRYR